MTFVPEKQGEGELVIGEGCHFDPGVAVVAIRRVEFGANVRVGAGVRVSDSSEGGVLVKEGALLGTGSSVSGNLTIGAFSIVLPGSFVVADVPDYAIVSGNPARHALFPVAASRAEPEAPLMSICLPTYNRSAFLDACLNSIFSQPFDRRLVEVVVSDNASTDDTPEVVKRYAELHPNVRYVRNETNIGADRNIFRVMKEAKGKFVKLQGDDDFYVEGTIEPLLDVLKRHGDCGIVHVHVHLNDGRVYTGEGAQAFLAASAIMSTFISGTVLRKEDLDRVERPDLFLDSSFNQMYLQYAILLRNPRFCVMNRSMFRYGSIEPGGYNFGRVVIGSYQAILRHFVGQGLTEDDVRFEKRRSLYGYILPWYRNIVQLKMKTDTSGFEETFKAHYESEPYYEEALALIKEIQAGG